MIRWSQMALWKAGGGRLQSQSRLLALLCCVMCPAHGKTESPVGGLCSQRPLIRGREALQHLFRVTQEWNIILFFEVLMCAESLQSCPTLCDPMDCSLPGSSVPGILQARALEWAAMPSSRDLLDPGVEPASLTSPALAGRFFTT